MHWTIILFLISLVLNVIIWHLLHNSLCRKSSWDKNPKPFRMPLVLWILFVVLTLVPVLNNISTLIYIIVMIVNYCEGTLELNEDFWLAKKYQRKALEETSGEQNPTSSRGVFIVGYLSHLMFGGKFKKKIKSKSRVQWKVKDENP